jgi:hypothetical protein
MNERRRIKTKKEVRYMSKQKIITGIKVTDQMAKAREILNTQVLPQEKLFQERKRNGQLTKEHVNVLQLNASFDNHCRM